MDVNSLRTRVGFGIFVTQLADSKPQTPRRGIGDSRDEPGFWMCRASPSPLLSTCCAGRLPILGYPVTKMLAHMLARAVDAVDFRPSRNGDGIAHSCHRNSMCKRGARCGAGSRALAFLDPLVWHGASVRTVGGGATRDAAMQTGAQLSPDSEQHVQARRALWSRFSDPRISRPPGVA